MNAKQMEILQRQYNIEIELESIIKLIDNFTEHQIKQIPKLLEVIKNGVIYVKENINEITKEVL